MLTAGHIATAATRRRGGRAGLEKFERGATRIAELTVEALYRRVIVGDETPSNVGLHAAASALAANATRSAPVYHAVRQAFDDAPVRSLKKLEEDLARDGNEGPAALPVASGFDCLQTHRIISSAFPDTNAAQRRLMATMVDRQSAVAAVVEYAALGDGAVPLAVATFAWRVHERIMGVGQALELLPVNVHMQEANLRRFLLHEAPSSYVSVLLRCVATGGELGGQVHYAPLLTSQPLLARALCQSTCAALGLAPYCHTLRAATQLLQRGWDTICEAERDLRRIRGAGCIRSVLRTLRALSREATPPAAARDAALSAVLSASIGALWSGVCERDEDDVAAELIGQACLSLGSGEEGARVDRAVAVSALDRYFLVSSATPSVPFRASAAELVRLAETLAVPLLADAHDANADSPRSAHVVRESLRGVLRRLLDLGEQRSALALAKKVLTALGPQRAADIITPSVADGLFVAAATLSRAPPSIPGFIDLKRCLATLASDDRVASRTPTITAVTRRASTTRAARRAGRHQSSSAADSVRDSFWHLPTGVHVLRRVHPDFAPPTVVRIDAGLMDRLFGLSPAADFGTARV
jgi:hypothetical protein